MLRDTNRVLRTLLSSIKFKMGDWCLALHMVGILILIDGVSKCSEGLSTLLTAPPTCDLLGQTFTRNRSGDHESVGSWMRVSQISKQSGGLEAEAPDLGAERASQRADGGTGLKPGL